MIRFLNKLSQNNKVLNGNNIMLQKTNKQKIPELMFQSFCSGEWSHIFLVISA